MSAKDSVSGKGRGTVRIIRKVVFTYRLEDDPEEMERTWTLEHDGAGEVVDGIIWNAQLMKKLAYLEQEKCTVPEKRPGKGGWKTYSAKPESGEQQPTATLAATELQAASDGGGDCFWFHDASCWWSEYCTGTQN